FYSRLTCRNLVFPRLRRYSDCGVPRFSSCVLCVGFGYAWWLYREIPSPNDSRNVSRPCYGNSEGFAWHKDVSLRSHPICFSHKRDCFLAVLLRVLFVAFSKAFSHTKHDRCYEAVGSSRSRLKCP